MAVGVDPDDLSGCIAWGTADDLASLTDGAAVTSWPSRVGPSLDSTAGGTAPTLVREAWASRPAVRFTAGAVLRRVAAMPAGFAGGGSGATLLVFARSRQASQTSQLLTVSTATASSARYSLRLAATTGTSFVGAAGRRLDADAAATLAGGGTFQWSVLDNIRPHALSLIVDHAGADAIIQQDGVQVHGSTAWGTTGTATATGAAALSVGCSPGDATSGFVGDVFAWAVFSRALAEGEAAQVAARWIDRLGLVPARPAPPVLPWDLDLDAMAASSRQTTGCWYSPVPTSRDNLPAPDVWDTAFVSPDGGQRPDQVQIGGLWRDRPERRAPRPESSWWLLDAVDVARWLQSCGIDGLATDVISPTAEFGRHWTFNRVHAMTGILTGFTVPFFLDGDGWRTNRTVAETADLIEVFDSYGSGWTLADGRRVIYVFAPELVAEPGQVAVGTVSSPVPTTSTMTAFFTNLDAALRTRGITPAWLFCPISGWPNYAAALADLTWSGSWWGSGQPHNSRNAKADAINARAAGKVWAQPLKAQDVRPRDKVADESGGTEAFRTQILGAIDGGADVVNLTTIGDHNEGTAWERTDKSGPGWAPILSYWLQGWKVGTLPPIVREGVLLAHRRQLKDAAPTDTRNTSRMVFRSGTAGRDDVEVTTWLTAPSTLEVTAGGVTTTYAAPAGWSVRNVPLTAVGPVSARVTRSGVDVVQVTSPVPVGTPVVQDLLRHPALAVADPPVLPTPTAPEPPLQLVRVWGGRVVPIVAEIVRPGGRRVRLNLTRRN